MIVRAAALHAARHVHAGHGLKNVGIPVNAGGILRRDLRPLTVNVQPRQPPPHLYRGMLPTVSVRTLLRLLLPERHPTPLVQTPLALVAQVVKAQQVVTRRLQAVTLRASVTDVRPSVAPLRRAASPRRRLQRTPKTRLRRRLLS